MSSAWASIVHKKPVTQKPDAQQPDTQKPDVYIPPVNRCIGCQNRLKLTNGVDKPVSDSSGVFDCLCIKCKNCGALYDYGLCGPDLYGGPCNCGNTELTCI